VAGWRDALAAMPFLLEDGSDDLVLDFGYLSGE
jgi:hypothetical protein